MPITYQIPSSLYLVVYTYHFMKKETAVSEGEDNKILLRLMSNHSKDKPIVIRKIMDVGDSGIISYTLTL